MQQRSVGIGMFLLLLSGAMFGCTRKPSYSRVTDDISFDKANKTQGNVDIVRVELDGAVVLQLHDNTDTITVRSSESTTLPNGATAVVIASDPELQTATIRMSIEAKGE